MAWVRILRSAAPGGFDRGDVDLAHVHHRIEGALGGDAVGVGDGIDQHAPIKGANKGGGGN